MPACFGKARLVVHEAAERVEGGGLQCVVAEIPARAVCLIESRRRGLELATQCLQVPTDDLQADRAAHVLRTRSELESLLDLWPSSIDVAERIEGTASDPMHKRLVSIRQRAHLLHSGCKLDAGSVGAVSTVLEDLQAFEALRDMLGASPDASVRERRLLTWFDALRTLRFIHLIEGPAGLPRLPLMSALGQAPFVTLNSGASELNAIRSALFSAEQALPGDFGVQTSVVSAVNHS